MKQLIGTGVALITPFKDDFSVDVEALKEIVNFQIDNGIDYLVVLGTTAEMGIEVFYRSECLHQELMVGYRVDKAVRLGVGLVLDLADDLLQHIFYGDQAGDAAILVYHNGHVIAIFTKFPQQHVEALALRHNHRRA